MSGLSPIASYPVGAPEFEIVTRRMREGVIGLDGEGRICLSNPAAAQMLGLDVPTVLGCAFATLINHAELLGLLNTAAALDDRAVHRQISVQVNREPRLIEVAIHTLAATSDQPIHRLMFLADVTALAQSARMKADFVANASHELRTPLSTMQAAAETLLGSAAHFDAHQRRFLEVITKNVERLKELAQDLLELNRAESPTLKVQARATRLKPMLGDLRRDYAGRMVERGIVLEIELDLPVIHADPKLLKVVLANLLDNAVKFVRRGEGRIEMRSGTEGSHAWIEVADNGIGITPEDQQRIFERFYQVDRARKETGASGTGLGLAIVKHAIAAMGGRVSLISAVDRGTTIRLLLPQPRAEDPQPGD